MNDVMVRVENLSKLYYIGAVQHKPDTLVQSLANSVSRATRRFLDSRLARIGTDEVNELWALRDVSFELKRGEVLGIIGRNGSGKSTLLKILSRVTAPTTGRVDLYGRVGSLLEVGTGFHPDLTGRENVYLNGAVLGMKRYEIDKIFDEIVDFSGVEKFIDTPVKHYSSGMYVRLAFAVAAHLDPEILILDEVLSVGDASFQKKSLDKMESAAKSGKTVLFVSHSIASVRRLCDKGIYLVDGKIAANGTAKEAASAHLKSIRLFNEDVKVENVQVLSPYADLRESKYRWNGYVAKILTSVSTHRITGEPAVKFNVGDSLRVRIGYHFEQPVEGYCRINFLDYSGSYVMTLHNTHNGPKLEMKGEGFLECVFYDLRLVAGDYSIMIEIGDDSQKEAKWLDCISNAILIKVQLGDYVGGVGTTQGEVTFVQKSQWQVHSDVSLMKTTSNSASNLLEAN